MCNLCSEYLYVMLFYVMLGCCAVSCLKNFSAQSDSVLFYASDNKRLEIVQMDLRLQLINLAFPPGCKAQTTPKPTTHQRK